MKYTLGFCIIATASFFFGISFGLDHPRCIKSEVIHDTIPIHYIKVVTSKETCRNFYYMGVMSPVNRMEEIDSQFELTFKSYK